VVAAGALVLAFAATGCGATRHAGFRGAELTDLWSVDQLRSRFAADHGHPRLLLLFSPT
jgi:hypothetical protein